MASNAAATASTLIESVGDFRWIRAHVSMFAVGAVLIVCINLILSSSSLWSLTAIGIWAILLLVHLLVLAIARLSNQLIADEDDEEIVLLPVKDAVIVAPSTEVTSSWTDVKAAQSTEEAPAQPGETVSWQIATDAAQANRENSEEQSS